MTKKKVTKKKVKNVLSSPFRYGRKDFEIINDFKEKNNINVSDIVIKNGLVNPIKSSLKVMGRTCNAQGSTIQEAITNLKPEITKGVGILTLEKAELKKEKIVNPRIINNLYGKFVSRLGREVALKQTVVYFAEFK